MKKIVSIFLICIMLLSCVSVFAADDMYVVSEKPITVTYNGETIAFPDALPLIQSDRTLVPARAIMERAALTVSFDAQARTVTAAKDDLTIFMTIDSAEATVTRGSETKSLTLEVPARIIDDRTYVPLRFIAESMDIKVNWNAYYREVVLIDTDEWKKELEASSQLLRQVLNTPLTNLAPYAGDSTGSFQLSLNAANLPDSFAGGNLNLDISFTFTGSGVFDGTNTGSYVLMETDLSFLKSLLADVAEIDSEMLNKIAKAYKIDLDVIIDSGYNLYIKSEGIVQLLRDFGEEKLADAIGERYIKIPLQDLVTATIGTDIETALASYETAWDILESVIQADDMLYTQSVITLDYLITLYADMFSDEHITVTEQADGASLMEFKLNTADFVSLVMNAAQNISALAGDSAGTADFAAAQAILEGMKYDMSLSMLSRDGKLEKTEASFTFDTGEIVLEETENPPTIRFAISANAVEAVRDFDASVDSNINAPVHIITLEELAEAMTAE